MHSPCSQCSVIPIPASSVGLCLHGPIGWCTCAEFYNVEWFWFWVCVSQNCFSVLLWKHRSKFYSPRKFPFLLTTKLTRACMLSCFRCVQLFVTSCIVIHQVPLSMGFSGKNTGVGCHFLLWGIFLTQGLNLSLLHWQADSLPLSHLGSPPFYCGLG